MKVADSWLHLRASLADPPGKARNGRGFRSDTYVAAMLQFEQLTIAAGSVAPFARPLLLYYAAGNAARALIAAFSPQPQTGRHGLKQPKAPLPEDVMAFEVEPHGTRNLLADLCALTGCEVPGEPILLSDLFLSLPDLSDKPQSLDGHKAIFLEEVPDPTQFQALRDPLMRIRLETEELPAQDQLYEVFPTLRGWHEEDENQNSITSRRQLARVFRSEQPIEYRDRKAALDAVAQTYRYSGDRWLIPTISGLSTPLSPLATWYVLLFGFSILARYEPAAWMRALGVRERHAVAIESSLEEAISALPELVWKQVTLAEVSARSRGQS